MPMSCTRAGMAPSEAKAGELAATARTSPIRPGHTRRASGPERLIGKGASSFAS